MAKSTSPVIAKHHRPQQQRQYQHQHQQGKQKAGGALSQIENNQNIPKSKRHFLAKKFFQSFIEKVLADPATSYYTYLHNEHKQKENVFSRIHTRVVSGVSMTSYNHLDPTKANPFETFRLVGTLLFKKWANPVHFWVIFVFST